MKNGKVNAMAAMAIAIAICGCGRESRLAETSAPSGNEAAQPAGKRQSAVPTNDVDAITNISAMTDDAPVVGHENDDEEFIESVLKLSGFDYGDGAQWGYCERRYFALKGYKSVLALEDEGDNVRAICDGPCNILEKNRPLAKDLVAKLNKTSADVAFHFDGNAIWCECAMPIKSIRRMTSRTEQRNALSRMLILTEKSMQPHKSVLEALETDSD